MDHFAAFDLFSFLKSKNKVNYKKAYKVKKQNYTLKYLSFAEDAVTVSPFL